MFTRYKSN